MEICGRVKKSWENSFLNISCWVLRILLDYDVEKYVFKIIKELF